MMNSGDRIRAARKDRKLTQKQLGELCGIAEPTIRRYELGKLNPKYETLQRIADALDIHIYALLGEDERHVFSLGEFEGGMSEFMRSREQGYTFSKKEQRMIAAFSKMDDEGQEKAADYVEDILHRYRRQDPAQPPAEASQAQDTPAAQDAPEGAEEGE